MTGSHVKRIVMALSLMAAAVVPASADSYAITINTSSTGLNLAGAGEMVFELSIGPSTTDDIVAAISKFNLEGGTPGAVRMSQGVTGSFTGGSTSLTIENLYQTSFYDQFVTFGKALSLDAGFTFTPPNTGRPDATSDFRILLGPPMFTTGIDAVDITYDAKGVPTITHVDAATVTPTPEPGWLAAAGLLLLVVLFRLRRLNAAR
ncbi:MAG: hypothetical protein JO270_02020 [Acidobacteriaceae bacterium]|nr:hypothetical protein [Acidobacteriaceae bacterium]